MHIYIYIYICIYIHNIYIYTYIHAYCLAQLCAAAHPGRPRAQDPVLQVFPVHFAASDCGGRSEIMMVTASARSEAEPRRRTAARLLTSAAMRRSPSRPPPPSGRRSPGHPSPTGSTAQAGGPQISELEPIITVRRPHRQRMSSAANALLCNIGEGKQCNLLSYFSALQHLCGTRSCGKRARKGHFHGHEHTCTHTRRQSALYSQAAELMNIALYSQAAELMNAEPPSARCKFSPSEFAEKNSQKERAGYWARISLHVARTRRRTHTTTAQQQGRFFSGVPELMPATQA